MSKNEEEAKQKIIRECNYMGMDLFEVGKMLAWEHNTLQQNFMRVVVGFIKEEAKKDYSDLRNEQTVLICKELVKHLEEVYLPYV